VTHGPVAPGRVTLISGWRFAQDDKIDGVAGWKAAHTARGAGSPEVQSQQGGKRAEAARTGVAMGDNGVLAGVCRCHRRFARYDQDAQGEVAFKLSDVPFGKFVTQLNGAVELERTAASTPLTDERSDDDYERCGRAGRHRVDRLHQLHAGLDRDERAKSYDKAPDDLKIPREAPGAISSGSAACAVTEMAPPIAITTPGRDYYKSAVAADGSGRVWVVWAENQAYKPFPGNGAASFDSGRDR